MSPRKPEPPDPLEAFLEALSNDDFHLPVQAEQALENAGPTGDNARAAMRYAENVQLASKFAHVVSTKKGKGVLNLTKRVAATDENANMLISRALDAATKGRIKAQKLMRILGPKKKRRPRPSKSKTTRKGAERG